MKTLLRHLRVKPSGRLSATLFSAWRPDLKVWHYYYASMLSIGRLVMGGLNRSRVLQISVFCKYVSALARRQGVPGVVLYLKAANVAIMQALPGSSMRAPSSRAISKSAVSLTRDGLPRMIPAFARGLIRAGHTPTIRLWLSLTGMYRLLRFKGVLKTNTITDPGVTLTPTFMLDWQGFITKIFLTGLGKFCDLGPLKGRNPNEQKPTVYANTSAGAPGSRGSLYSSFGLRCENAKAWSDSIWTTESEGEQTNALYWYLYEIGQVGYTNSLWHLIDECAEWSAWGDGADFGPNGRLLLKEEPAGKIRVFAAVDYWTQVALRPLHKFIMGILKRIPTDGTYDQLKPVKALLARVPMSQTIYSFDLSAATDRLPLALQQSILGAIYGGEFAKAWAHLLVGREYRLGGNRGEALRYAVGQPMGAYSSWAMLALTHHALVQYCAYLVGYREGWFRAYAVLGDDVIIADDTVAWRYQALMQEIGVEIGLSKSLIASGRTAEFAKRLYFRGEDVSGLPHSLWNAAQQSIGVAHAMVTRLASQRRVSMQDVVAALGGGMKAVSSLGSYWRVIPRRVAALAVVLTHPASSTPFSRKDWPEWLLQKGPLVQESAGPKDQRFLPWATGLLTEAIEPASEQLDKLHAELFFGGSPPSLGLKPNQGGARPSDMAGRLLEADVNKALVAAERIVELHKKSLTHLQSLDVKFLPHQVSAIVNQIIDGIGDRLQLPPLAWVASRPSRPEGEDVWIPATTMVSTWKRLRARIMVGTPPGWASPWESVGDEALHASSNTQVSANPVKTRAENSGTNST